MIDKTSAREMLDVVEKATPGPWTADETEVISDDCAYHPIADCIGNHTCRSEEEQFANAAAIATLPALAAHLRIFIAHTEALEGEVETERMRLAACGVIAISDTPESAREARQMLPEYRSGSLTHVERRVDECIALRAEVERLNVFEQRCIRMLEFMDIQAKIILERNARIDSLMLEFCPEQMTTQQKEKWAGHQQAFAGRRTGRDRADIPTDAGVPSRIDIIGSNGNEGLHYEQQSEYAMCSEAMRNCPADHLRGDAHDGGE